MKMLRTVVTRCAVILLVASLVAVALVGLWRVPAVRTVAMRADVLATIGVRHRPASGRMWGWRAAPFESPSAAEADRQGSADPGAVAGGRASGEPAAPRRFGRGAGGDAVARGEGRSAAPPAGAQEWGGQGFGGFRQHARAGWQEPSPTAGLRQLWEALSIVGVVAALVVGSRWLAGYLRRPSGPAQMAATDIRTGD